ncbi:MAG: class I SAM-dependent rRNA methyltransferase [Proteobacteria bacterium]|nr:class I SAM-dependent rRNA methyltransferase [Pseudomonadota bacterium]
MKDLPRVTLRPDRDRAPRRGHPWIMSGSVEAVEGDPGPGAAVAVASASGETLGWGDYDPGSQIRVRLCQLGPETGWKSGDEWLAAGLEAALGLRERHPLLRDTDALRLANAESDGLPGLTVDRYADWLVVKPGTPAMLTRVPAVAEALAGRTGVKGVWLRGAAPGAARDLIGEVPDRPVTIEERGRRYVVDLRRGQKTGFYLDQRDARDLFQRLSPGRRVADLFAYSGGFSVAALNGGAESVVAVESSPAAIELLRRNAPGARILGSDAGEFLRETDERFDLLALDPPPLAKRRRDAGSASRAYKDLNLRALRIANPGAFLLTFCCSHHVDAGLFRKILFGAALDAGVGARLLATLGAPPDHPISLNHPESEYLKGLLLQIER